MQSPQTTSPASPEATNNRLAIILILIVSFVYSIQDGVSRHLGQMIPVPVMIMFRYWFMACFVILLCARKPGGLRAAINTKRPFLQITRGVLLVVEIMLITESFVRLGLVESHAVFIAHPLIAIGLAVLILGEQIGWRRWTAVLIGFLGVMVVLQPGAAVFSPTALLALGSATIYALYGVLTRLASRVDPPDVSFFWTGIAGVVASTLYGLPQLGPVPGEAWPFIVAVCLTGVTGNWLMIQAYSRAEASALQPFTYTQLIWAVMIGYFIFNERVGNNVVAGGLIILSAGLFTVLRTRQKETSAD